MMKKFFTLLMLGTVLVACSRKEEPEVIEQPETPVTYTLSISACKNSDTKALELDDNTLNAIWDTSDFVYVFLNENLTDYVAILNPESSSIYPDKNSCTLTGTFTTIPQNGDVLTLRLTSNNYSQQKGTLEYIAEWCDYAVATLHVTGVVDGQIQSTEGTAAFASQQAIVKFTLMNGDMRLNPTSLTINDGTSDVATVTDIPDDTYITNGGGVLYVAVPAITGKTITLTATVGVNTYIYQKSGVTFVNGQYYTRSVKMYSPIVDLSSLSADYTAKNGQTLTGTLANNVKVSIAAGATVILNGVSINEEGTWKTGNYAGITCLGDATIVLKDESMNTVKGFHNNYPGIYVPAGSTLTIKGETLGNGALNASSNYHESGAAAGIGGGWDLPCGNIEIQGGEIIASGSTGAAGIGSCNRGCGTITISGGTVTAYGGPSGAGIGSGSDSDSNYGCGNITISGGTVLATGGFNSAGIGSGYTGRCGNITIGSDVTSVSATRGAGECIGAGYNGYRGTVTVASGLKDTTDGDTRTITH